MQETLEKLTVTHHQSSDNLATNLQQQSLRSCTERALQNYFAQLGDTLPNSLYELVLAEIETPLLEVVLQQTKGNQTQAANLLGLSRGTLRKKLKQYNLD